MRSKTPPPGSSRASHGARTDRPWIDARQPARERLCAFLNALQVSVLESQLLPADERRRRTIAVAAEFPRSLSLPGQMILHSVLGTVTNKVAADAGTPIAWSPERAKPASIPVRYADERLLEFVTGALGPVTTPHPKIVLAQQRVSAAYHDPAMNTRTMADFVGCSEAHFGRLFSRAAGCTFRTYLRRRRLGVAVELLSEGRLSIKEIAAAVGYKHVADFDRHFKVHVGACPRSVRAQSMARQT